MERNSRKTMKNTKAGAVLCPVCCVECIKVRFDCEIDGIEIQDVEALRCPKCEEEKFSPEQIEKIIEKIKIKQDQK
ncbi:MAG: hypothetical protein IAX22_05495 [Candidatus Bathyarchaeota archaeon]|nr:hypothetical protein [Candidatus Bathyarchaeota archaeon]